MEGGGGWETYLWKVRMGQLSVCSQVLHLPIASLPRRHRQNSPAIV